MSAKVAIIGAGPAGLMAAEVIARAGWTVDIYDAMPSAGRKFLLAGRGGLNLTHSEPRAAFIARYGPSQAIIARWLNAFGPDELRAWAHTLGVETFVGSSGRVFPRGMKAAPLLRRWLRRLDGLGVRWHFRHRWLGWDKHQALRFATPQGEQSATSAATLLALGGASYPHLGSDGRWTEILSARGIPITTLAPANCGFECAWSPYLRQKFSGAPLKTVVLSLPWSKFQRRGECVVSAYGLEGSLIYAASSLIRERIQAHGEACIYFDLLPDFSLAALTARLSRPRGKRSWSEHLRRTAGLHGVKAALLREAYPDGLPKTPSALAAASKHLPIHLLRPRPLAEAISTAGGISLQALDEHLMLRHMPGLFCAGEMLDWEAPTGGYLLTAVFASGYLAGQGICRYLSGRPSNNSL